MREAPGAAAGANELISAPCAVCSEERAAPLFDLDFDERYPAGMRLVRCRSCRTERIDPHPGPAGLAALYDSDYFQEGYLPFEERRRADFRRRLSELESFPPVRLARRLGRAPRCLDVGAGIGLFMVEARNRGYRVEGVEPSTAGRQLAADRHGLKLREGWPAAGEEFDLVTFWDVLGHAEDPLGLLAEARRRLEPGGGVVLKLPNFRSAWYRVRTWMSRRRRVNLLHAPTVIWRFHRAGAIRILRRSGFELEWTRTVIEPDLIPLTARWRLVRQATSAIDSILDSRQEMILYARSR
jgi:SAM-dependent methyltransferase